MSLLENTNELFFKFQHFLLFLAVSLFHRKSPDHLLSDYGVRMCLVYLFVYSALKRKVCVYIILEIVLGSVRKHLEPSSNLFLGGGMFPLLLPILVLNWYLTTPNLALLNNKHVLSHSVCGSGIWVWLSWGHLAQGHSQGCSQFISQGLCHLKTWWWKSLLAIQAHAHGYWQASGLPWLLASLPCGASCHGGSTGSSQNGRWFPSEQMRASSPTQKPTPFCNLTLKVTSHHIYHTWRSKSLDTATLKGRELHPRTWILGGRAYGGDFRDCLPHFLGQRTISNMQSGAGLQTQEGL